MKVQFILLLILAFSMIIVGGCQSQSLSLSSENMYSIDKVASKAVEVLWADVCEQRGQILVLGSIRRLGHSNAPLRTHIDVQVLSPDGKLLYEHKTKAITVPGRCIGFNVGITRFSIVLPEQPPRNSRIRLICHTGDYVQTSS